MANKYVLPARKRDPKTHVLKDIKLTKKDVVALAEDYVISGRRSTDALQWKKYVLSRGLFSLELYPMLDEMCATFFKRLAAFEKDVSFRKATKDEVAAYQIKTLRRLMASGFFTHKPLCVCMMCEAEVDEDALTAETALLEKRALDCPFCKRESVTSKRRYLSHMCQSLNAYSSTKAKELFDELGIMVISPIKYQAVGVQGVAADA